MVLLLCFSKWARLFVLPGYRPLLETHNDNPAATYKTHQQCSNKIATYSVDCGHAGSRSEGVGVKLSHAGRDGGEDDRRVNVIDVVGAIGYVNDAQDDVRNPRDR